MRVLGGEWSDAAGTHMIKSKCGFRWAACVYVFRTLFIPLGRGFLYWKVDSCV